MEEKESDIIQSLILMREALEASTLVAKQRIDEHGNVLNLVFTYFVKLLI